MKIVLLCSCLEPGRDGVGDYTRRLATELIRQGNDCLLIGLLDSFVDYNKIEDTQINEGIAIKTLRYSKKRGISINCQEAKIGILEFKPSWISIQFVPFAFNDKGLPYNLGKSIISITKICNLHMMFHELWVMNRGLNSTLRRAAQKMIFKKLLRLLRPKIVHTNTELYRFNLKEINCRATLLPLFSNIPLVKHNDLNVSNVQQINFVSFGTIYRDTNFLDFARQVSEIAKKNKIRCRLTIIGRAGSNQSIWISEWEKHDMEVIVKGEIDATEIGKIFCQSSFGIISTPLAILEKSGSYTAMRDYGLPVICVSKPWHPDGFNISHNPEVGDFNKINLEEFLTKSKFSLQDSVLNTARQFTCDLIKAEANDTLHI